MHAGDTGGADEGERYEHEGQEAGEGHSTYLTPDEEFDEDGGGGTSQAGELSEDTPAPQTESGASGARSEPQEGDGGGDEGRRVVFYDARNQGSLFLYPEKVHHRSVAFAYGGDDAASIIVLPDTSGQVRAFVHFGHSLRVILHNSAFGVWHTHTRVEGDVPTDFDRLFPYDAQDRRIMFMLDYPVPVDHCDLSSTQHGHDYYIPEYIATDAVSYPLSKCVQSYASRVDCMWDKRAFAQFVNDDAGMPAACITLREVLDVALSSMSGVDTARAAEATAAMRGLVCAGAAAVTAERVIDTCRKAHGLLSAQRILHVSALAQPRAGTYSNTRMAVQQLGLVCVPSAALLRRVLVERGTDAYRACTVCQKQILDVTRSLASVRTLDAGVSGNALKPLTHAMSALGDCAADPRVGVVAVECVRGYYASRAQVDLVRAMRDTAVAPVDASDGGVWEQIMGSGKSSVVGPALVAQLALVHARFVVCAVPDFMYADAVGLMFMPLRFFSAYDYGATGAGSLPGSVLTAAHYGRAMEHMACAVAAQPFVGEVNEGAAGTAQPPNAAPATLDLGSVALACSLLRNQVLRGGACVVKDTQLRLAAATDASRVFATTTASPEQFVMLVDEYDLLTHPTTSELNVPTEPYVDRTIAVCVEYSFKVLASVLSRYSALKSRPEEPSRLWEMIGAANERTPGCISASPMLYVNDLDAFSKHVAPYLCSAFPVPASVLQSHSAGTYVTNAVGAILTLAYRVQYGPCARDDARAAEDEDAEDLWDPDIALRSTPVATRRADARGALPGTETFECVPYKAKDVPMKGSKFGDMMTRIGTSCVSRIVSGLSEPECRLVLDRIRDWIKAGDVRGSLALLQVFSGKDATDKMTFLRDMSHPGSLSALVRVASRHYYAVYLFCTLLLAESLSQTMRLKCTTNGSSVYACPVAFVRRVGFTGTPSTLRSVWFAGGGLDESGEEVELRNASMPAVHADAASSEHVDAALGTPAVNVGVIVVETEHASQQLQSQPQPDAAPTAASLEMALVRHAAHLAVHRGLVAVIDTGALVLALNNAQFSRALANEVRACAASTAVSRAASVPHVVFYIDDNDRAGAIAVSTGQSVDPSLYSYDRGIMYYDNAHTTGVDRPLRVDGMGLVTVSRHTTWRDYAQGAFRLRQLGVPGGQTIMTFVEASFAQYVCSAGYTVHDPRKLVDYMRHVARLTVISQEPTVIKHSAQALLNSARVVAYGMGFALPLKDFAVDTHSASVMPATPHQSIDDCKVKLLCVRDKVKSLAFAYPASAAALVARLDRWVEHIDYLDGICSAVSARDDAHALAATTTATTMTIVTNMQTEAQVQRVHAQTGAQEQVEHVAQAQAQVQAEVLAQVQRYHHEFVDPAAEEFVTEKHELTWDDVETIASAYATMSADVCDVELQFGEAHAQIDLANGDQDGGANGGTRRQRHALEQGAGRARGHAPSAGERQGVVASPVQICSLASARRKLSAKAVHPYANRVFGMGVDSAGTCTVWVDGVAVRHVGAQGDPFAACASNVTIKPRAWILYVPHPTASSMHALVVISHCQVLSLLTSARYGCATRCMLLDAYTLEPIFRMPFGARASDVAYSKNAIDTTALDGLQTLMGFAPASTALLSRAFSTAFTREEEEFLRELHSPVGAARSFSAARAHSWVHTYLRMRDARTDPNAFMFKVFSFEECPTQAGLDELWNIIYGNSSGIDLMHVSDSSIMQSLCRMLSVDMLSAVGAFVTSSMPVSHTRARGIASASCLASHARVTLGHAYDAMRASDDAITRALSTFNSGNEQEKHMPLFVLMHVSDSVSCDALYAALSFAAFKMYMGGKLFEAERHEIKRECALLVNALNAGISGTPPGAGAAPTAALRNDDPRMLLPSEIAAFAEACSVDEIEATRALPLRNLVDRPYSFSSNATLSVPPVHTPRERAIVAVPSLRCAPVKVTWAWLLWSNVRHMVPCRIAPREGLPAFAFWCESLPVYGVRGTVGPSGVLQVAYDRAKGTDKLNLVVMGASPKNMVRIYRLLPDPAPDTEHNVFVLAHLTVRSVVKTTAEGPRARKRSRARAQENNSWNYVVRTNAVCAGDCADALRICAPQWFSRNLVIPPEDFMIRFTQLALPPRVRVAYVGIDPSTSPVDVVVVFVLPLV